MYASPERREKNKTRGPKRDLSASVDKMNLINPIYNLRARETNRTRCGSPSDKTFLVACGPPFTRLAKQRLVVDARDARVISESSTRALSRHLSGAGGHRSHRTTAMPQMCAPTLRQAKVCID